MGPSKHSLLTTSAQKALQRLKRPRLSLAVVSWLLLGALLIAQHYSGSNCSCKDQSDHQQQAEGLAGLTADATTLAADVLQPRFHRLSQQRVRELIQQAPPVHGRQTKSGLPPANMSFILAHMPDSLNTKPQFTHGLPPTMGPAVYRWFAAAFTYNRTLGGSNRDLQSPIPACQFFLDHKHKMLYVRNTKTAGTSICLQLGQKELPMWCFIRPETCYNKCRDKQICLEFVTDQEVLKKAFKEYTVFSFIRNPWARALSSWHHINKHGMHQNCIDPFHQFAAAPSAYAAKCMGIRDCCRERFGWLLAHLEAQSTCNYDADGRPVVDYFGRVEHLQEDMNELFDIVNSRLPNGTPALRYEKMPRYQLAREDMKSDQEQLWQYYASLYMNNTALEDVLSYFSRDFEKFGYPTTMPQV